MSDALSYLNQIQLELEAAQNRLNAMRDMVMEARKAINPQPMKRLEVPWLSQLGPQAAYAPGDCGTACIAMIANYRGTKCTVDDVSKVTHRPAGFLLLSFDELIAAGQHFGFTLQHASGVTLDKFRMDIDIGNPVIVLVNYRSLPASNRYDAKYNAGHYIVMVGYGSDAVVYHDPYWQTSEGGAFRVMTDKEFETAYSTTAPGNTYAYHALRITA